MIAPEQQITALAVLVRQLQGYVRWGEGDPNGVEDGPRGAQWADTLTGDVYRKTTELGTVTGWVTP